MSLKGERHGEDKLRGLFAGAEAKGWKAPDPFPIESDIRKSSPNGFFPAETHIFKAFELVGPSDVKYVIIGQDPYPNYKDTKDSKLEANATGLAFLIDPDRSTSPPPSFKALEGRLFPNWATFRGKSLSDWEGAVEDKGVLLLNAALTVPRPYTMDGKNVKCAGAHLSLWKNFMADMVKQVLAESHDAQMYAFGKSAKEIVCEAMRIAGKFHYCNHPAPPAKPDEDFWKGPGGKKLSSLFGA